MEIADKRRGFRQQRERTIENNNKFYSLTDTGKTRNKRDLSSERKMFKKRSEKESGSKSLLPVVKTSSFTNVRTNTKTANMSENGIANHRFTAGIWKSKTNGFTSNVRNRNRFAARNRTTYPLLSSIDRRMLNSFGSFTHPMNAKKTFLFTSDSALNIKPIELQPRQRNIRKFNRTVETELQKSQPNDLINNPIFPSLTGGFNVEPLYMYSPPSFSPSDEVDSLAFLLDGISLSPPPPSELSFSSPSLSPMFSPLHDFED